MCSLCVGKRTGFFHAYNAAAHPILPVKIKTDRGRLDVQQSGAVRHEHCKAACADRSRKRELLARAHAGDAAAREQMVEGNLRLVLSVVQRFAQRGENLDDLFQVGCIGLIKAIDHFDPAQPVRFSTYGVPMIIGEIRRFLRDNNALRVSRSLRDTAYRAMQSREALEKQLGREPTMDEIAQAAGLARREVTAALESVVEPISLEEPVYTDGGDAMYVIDQVRDPDGEDSWISGLQFRQTVAGLTPREKRIMELRYLQGRPRWRWRGRSASVRHRSAGWKKAH